MELVHVFSYAGNNSFFTAWITWGTRHRKTQTEFSLEFLLLETEETPSITILRSSPDYLSQNLFEKTEGERKSVMHVTAD